MNPWASTAGYECGGDNSSYAVADVHRAMDSDKKNLYHTRSVAVTPAPVRVPTQRPLVG